MSDAEDVVERVLAGLREAQAPEGMERRVLERLQERAGEARALAWWPGVRRWVVAGAAMAVMVVCWTAFHGTRPRPERARVEVSPTPRSMPAGAVGTTAVTRLPTRARAEHGAHRQRQTRRVSAPVARGDYPAPEMPLTEEERLLQRMARQRPPEQVAMLDPEMLAELEAKETAEFLHFLRTTKDGR